MKTKLLLGISAVVLSAAAFFPRNAEGQPAPAPKGPVEAPIGLDCVITVETQAWMNTSNAPPDSITGFHPDFTVRGKAIYWGADWIVLKDGTYENWISRDKVLTVRVSR